MMVITIITTKLSCVADYIPWWYTHLEMVTHSSTNLAQRIATTLIKTYLLVVTTIFCRWSLLFLCKLFSYCEWFCLLEMHNHCLKKFMHCQESNIPASHNRIQPVREPAKSASRRKFKNNIY